MTQLSKTTPKIQKHQAERMRLWIDTFAQVAGSIGCMNPEHAATWADAAVKEFDKRFN